MGKFRLLSNEFNDNSERAKLLRRPWGLRDVMREKKAAEKRRVLVEKERKKWQKKNK